MASDPAPATPVLFSVGDVACLLNCSKQHIRRLADAGRMPRPVKLGGLVRWNRAEIENWIAAGCPDHRRKSMSLAVRVST
jgi:excisionase family DNA binding protein